MKKECLLTILCFAAISASAQLKVNSNGKVFIQSTVQDTCSALTIGDDSENYNGCSIGIRSYKMQQQSSNYYTMGIIGKAECNSNTFGTAIGVNGKAIGANGFRNFGMLAEINPDCQGAGIYASSEGGIVPYSTSGCYAAYLYGDTYADGNMTVACSFYNLSDMRLKENVVSVSGTKNQGSILNKLENLDVFSYNLKRPSSLNGGMSKRDLKDWEQADVQRTHYGVSAQELQNIFPDLVREGQDGYLTVNYTELIPLLLRAIQELKGELDEVKGNNSAGARIIPATTDVTSAIKGANVLYQNTPNPFKEQTTIRFSLADDAQDASICIFDMTGKMLKNLPISSGDTSISLNGWELGEGMFLYTLIVNGREIDTKRMIITK